MFDTRRSLHESKPVSVYQHALSVKLRGGTFSHFLFRGIWLFYARTHTHKAVEAMISKQKKEGKLLQLLDTVSLFCFQRCLGDYIVANVKNLGSFLQEL